MLSNFTVRHNSGLMGPSRHAFSIANDKITKNRRKMLVFGVFLNQEVPCWSEDEASLAVRSL